MISTDDLKFVAKCLSLPPFSKPGISAIALHDDLPVSSLIQILSDVCCYVYEQQTKIDIRQEAPEETAFRITEFLKLLKHRAASEEETYSQSILNGKRDVIIEALFFLLKDLATHKKRAYLAPFLAAVEIPSEFSHDEGLVQQLEELQEQFKNAHKYVDSLRQPGTLTASIKRELQQMEDEKQQVTNKIARIKKKVEDMPDHSTWLEAAKNLRLEHQNENSIAERIKEQKNQTEQCEAKIEKLRDNLKEVKGIMAGGGAEALMSKMEEELKMNKYLATENLPKQYDNLQTKIKDFTKVLSEPALSDKELKPMEVEIKTLNEEIAALAEKKIEKQKTLEGDKLALFRQQSSIITRKKEGTAQKLKTLTDQVAKLEEEYNSKNNALKGVNGTKMLRGEEFKKYVSELRGKSNIYKRKKAELSEFATELGILQRTEEILVQKEASLKDSIKTLERKKGIAGYNEAQETLEKVSEKKSELDEKKGKTLAEISDIVKNLMETINGKKNKLAPIIQELRGIRQQVQEAEAEYVEKKKHYDAAMMGLDSETVALEHEVKGYRNDILNDQSRYHYLSIMLQSAEITHEKVMGEMKAYIGGDEVIEQQQRHRGFKTYRDVYNKRMSELEHTGKVLRETQKDIKNQYEPNMKQLAMFNDLNKFLMMKINYNKSLLSTGGKTDEFEGSVVTENRLIL